MVLMLGATAHTCNLTLHGLRTHSRNYESTILRSDAQQCWMPPPNGAPPSFRFAVEAAHLPDLRTAWLKKDDRGQKTIITSAPPACSSRSRLKEIASRKTNLFQRPPGRLSWKKTRHRWFRERERCFSRSIKAIKAGQAALVSASARTHRVQRNRHAGGSRNFKIPRSVQRDGTPFRPHAYGYSAVKRSLNIFIDPRRHQEKIQETSTPWPLNFPVVQHTHVPRISPGSRDYPCTAWGNPTTT